MEKSDLLREVFRLANGPRNFRVWLGNRATQYADEFAAFGPRKDLMKRFIETGECKLPQWIDAIVEIYGRHLTEEEAGLLYRELTELRAQYGFNRDIPDEALSREAVAIFEKIVSFQEEIDEAMHEMLPIIIRATILIGQSQN